MKKRFTLGCREIVGINVSDHEPLVMKAVIDTGALYSSLHAENLVVSSGVVTGCTNWVLNGIEYDWQFCLPLIYRKKVRVSNDLVEWRPVVQLPVELAEITTDTLFTLTDRSNRKLPCLLGIKYLVEMGAFVDVSRAYIHKNLSVYNTLVSSTRADDSR